MWNSTPSAATKRTKLARKASPFIVWVASIIALVLVASAVLYVRTLPHSQPLLQVGNRSYAATVLRTETELQKGLSGTERLASDHAMVFVFPHDAKWGIWMKDMNYPIDILWLDKAHKVVHMVADAQPSSYPKTTFTPAAKARYVIELPSGTIKATGVTIGTIVALPPGM